MDLKGLHLFNYEKGFVDHACFVRFCGYYNKKKLLIVIFIRKRNETFIILTPLLMLVGNVCNSIACYFMLNAE